MTSTSSSGSLGFIVCVKCCRMVDSVPRWQLSLSWPIQSDHLSMILPLEREYSHYKKVIFRKNLVYFIRLWQTHEYSDQKRLLSVGHLSSFSGGFECMIFAPAEKGLYVVQSLKYFWVKWKKVISRKICCVSFRLAAGSTYLLGLLLHIFRD